MKMRQITHRHLFLCIALIVTFAIIILRKEDAFSNPQFWAEDGTAWYYDAYNDGPVEPLLKPRNGYLQTISRLAGSVSLLIPLAHVPLFFNLIALIAQALPVIILLSKRWDKLIPSLAIRSLIGCILLFLPNSQEVHLNLTNVQWHLAVSSILLILGSPPSYKYWKIIDRLYLLIAGISGPFSIFLSPIAIIISKVRKTKKSFFYAKIVTCTGIVQLLTYVATNEGGRSVAHSANNIDSLFTIFLNQIVWGGLIGSIGIEWIKIRLPWADQFLLVSSIVAFTLIVYAVIKGQIEIKLFIASGAAIFFLASFISLESSTAHRWESLSTAFGLRYWHIPIISFIAVLFWSLKKSNPRIVRATGAFFIASIILFRFYSFQNKQMYTFPPFENYDYLTHVQEFNKMNKGEVHVFPLNPSGWEMALTKK